MNNSANFHQTVLEQLPGIIVIMDLHSKFIYSNQNTAHLFGYKTVEAMVGIDAYGMRCPAVESAADFIAQDKKVINENKEISILDIHTYAGNQPKILLTKKKPYRVNNIDAGSICFCTEVHSDTFARICATITQADKQFYQKNKPTNRSYLVEDVYNKCTLTTRERECIYYMIRGQTIKQTAKSLNISPRTVETHKENIKNKWNCQHHNEIIEMAIAKGYLTFLPKSTLANNLSHILYYP